MREVKTRKTDNIRPFTPSSSALVLLPSRGSLKIRREMNRASIKFLSRDFFSCSLGDIHAPPSSSHVVFPCFVSHWPLRLPSLKRLSPLVLCVCGCVQYATLKSSFFVLLQKPLLGKLPPETLLCVWVASKVERGVCGRFSEGKKNCYNQNHWHIWKLTIQSGIGQPGWFNFVGAVIGVKGLQSQGEVMSFWCQLPLKM